MKGLLSSKLIHKQLELDSAVQLQDQRRACASGLSHPQGEQLGYSHTQTPVNQWRAAEGSGEAGLQLPREKPTVSEMQALAVR